MYSENGYHDIAYRLLEYQYELTDRLGFYVCERKPDHSSGQHFVIPISDSLGSNSEVAKSAKRKLQLVIDIELSIFLIYIQPLYLLGILEGFSRIIVTDKL